MAIYDAPVSEIRRLVDPLDGGMWCCLPIGVEEIHEAEPAEVFLTTSWSALVQTLPASLHRTFHINRIAALMKLGIPEDGEHPITLAITDSDSWFVDGNHRMAAKIARGDETIRLIIAFTSEAGHTLADRVPGAVMVDDRPGTP